jgi:serine/threonine protein kinase
VSADVTRTVGRYEILEEIGRGGMATVYLARQSELRRLVALKELSALRQADISFTHRFLRESRLAGSLTHPNIVTVHDYFEEDGVPYIAMEYVPGGSLRPHIGHMSLSQVGGVLEGMLSALEHAARNDVVHRDLKPENVLVTADGRVKITDFGIAKATGSAQTATFQTTAGMTVGTPSYMAPEQAMGQEVGPWTDLYSVGVMAFEFFVGHVPFSDTEEPMAILMRQVSDPIPPVRSVNPDVDAATSDWIGRLLAKDPEERIRSAHDAWDEFEDIVVGLVGPRWRRSARLLEPSQRPPETPAGPATPPPTQAPQPPLMPTVMPDAPPPVPDEPRLVARRRPLRRAPGLAKGLVLAFLLLAALAAVVGRLGSGSETSSRGSAVTPTAPVTGGDLGLRVPRNWSTVARPPELGLPLSNPVAVGPGGRGGGPVVEFGMVEGGTADNGALLPASFLGATGGSTDSVPRRTAVRLPAQNLEAWRYRNLRPVGIGRTLTVYAVPTSRGVGTVVCAVPGAQAAGFAQQCDAIAGTLRLARGTPFPVGPSPAYASALNATVGDLQRSAAAAEQTLQGSETLAGQAAAARTLAGLYEGAARRLAGLELSPADAAANADLVNALRSAGATYRRAASAATAGDANAYAAASAEVPGARDRVNSALAAIRAAGYQPATATGSTPQAGGAAPAESRPSGESQEPDTGGSESSGSGQPQPGVGDSRSDDPSDDQEEN